jgi:hypothetical protein
VHLVHASLAGDERGVAAVVGAAVVAGAVAEDYGAFTDIPDVVPTSESSNDRIEKDFVVGSMKANVFFDCRYYSCDGLQVSVFLPFPGRSEFSKSLFCSL